MHKIWRLSIIIMLAVSSFARAETTEELGKAFWDWRMDQAPIANHNDEIWRFIKSDGWVPDYSPETIASWRATIDDFEARHAAIDIAGASREDEVDWRLLGSGIARARYELDIVPLWQRSPKFYLDQTIGSVRVLFMKRPPVESARAIEIIRRLNAFPTVLAQAKANLTDFRAPYGPYALEELVDIEERMDIVATELTKNIPAEHMDALMDAAAAATAALVEFKVWIEAETPNANPEAYVGLDAIRFKMHRIQMIPYTIEEMKTIAERALKKATASNAFYDHGATYENTLAEMPDLESLIAATDYWDLYVRKQLNEKRFVTVPNWVGRYRIAEIPEYLKPIKLWSANDMNLWNPPGEDRHYYQFPKGEGVGSSAGLSIYRDPRGSIVHNGVPGHTLMFALARSNPRTLRHYSYSVTALEGVPCYAQIAMQKAGFFVDNPWIDEQMRNAVERWALGVIREVEIHSGELNWAEANEKHVINSGRLGNPLNGLGAMMGLHQLNELVGEVKMAEGDEFDLLPLHDYIWANNNVQPTLLRFEKLGLRGQLDKLDRLIAAN